MVAQKYLSLMEARSRPALCPCRRRERRCSNELGCHSSLLGWLVRYTHATQSGRPKPAMFNIALLSKVERPSGAIGKDLCLSGNDKDHGPCRATCLGLSRA